MTEEFERITTCSYEVSEDWYRDRIESPLIPTVRFLRNNGINTTGACAHEKWIVCMGFHPEADGGYIRRLLSRYGYKKFEVKASWNNGYWLITITIQEKLRKRIIRRKEVQKNDIGIDS